jgi:hypothetical protein
MAGIDPSKPEDQASHARHPKCMCCCCRGNSARAWCYSAFLGYHLQYMHEAFTRHCMRCPSHLFLRFAVVIA